VRIWAEIDLRAAGANLRAVSRACEGRPVLAVVKADAYGHGAEHLARAFEGAGAARLGVADLAEAAALQDAGITLTLQILGALLAGEMREAVARGLVITVSSREQIDRVGAAAASLGTRARVHLKLDTGMGRLGASPQEAPPLARRIARESALEFEGLMTHLSSAASDEAFTREQIARFDRVLGALEREGLAPSVVHAANSSGAAFYPEARYTMIRPGLALYGAVEDEREREAYDLTPVMELKTLLVFAKDVPAGASIGYDRTCVTEHSTRIGILSCGYADGVPRALSNRGEVLIRGRRAPLVGRVSMDYAAVDLGGIPEAAVGDQVVLVGAQGDERIRVEEVARLAGRIPYEISCGLGRRVSRIYRGEPKEDPT